LPLKLVRRSYSPHWIVRGSVRGVRFEESTGTGDRRWAEEIRAKREAEILAESVYGRRATITFASAALNYLENGGSNRFMAPVLKHFGVTPLAKIDQHAIEKMALKLYPNASDATRNRQAYTPACAALRHAARRGWCSPIILERPEPSEDRVRWLLLDECCKLRSAGSPCPTRECAG
jgi:hypothetical protein